MSYRVTVSVDVNEGSEVTAIDLVTYTLSGDIRIGTPTMVGVEPVDPSEWCSQCGATRACACVKRKWAENE